MWQARLNVLGGPGPQDQGNNWEPPNNKKKNKKTQEINVRNNG